MPVEKTRRVSDAESLKAVAHPLRVRLLGSLRVDGPATSTELGRRFGENTGTTSYHLRQLEKYGFIEEDPDQPNARDRRWRARHRYTYWANSDFVDDPAGREAARWMRHHQVQVIGEAIQRFDDRVDSWSREWVDAASISDDTVRLTPASLKDLHGRVMALVHEYAVRDGASADADADAADVFVFLGGYPRKGRQP